MTIKVKNGNLGSIFVTIINLRTILRVFTIINVKSGYLGFICVNTSLVQVWEPLYMFWRQLRWKVIIYVLFAWMFDYYKFENHFIYFDDNWGEK